MRGAELLRPVEQRGLLSRLAELMFQPVGSAAACAVGAAFGLWLGYAGPADIQAAATAIYADAGLSAASEEDFFDIGFADQEDAL